MDALIDSGADISLISEATVQKRGIETEPLENALWIVLANQTRVRATRCVPALPLARGEWRDRVRCVVVPTLTQPLFLGRDWLVRWNPMIDWVTGCLSIGDDSHQWSPRGDTVADGQWLNPEIDDQEITPFGVSQAGANCWEE